MKNLSLLTLFTIALTGLWAQPGITLPNASQKVSIVQTIGISELGVTYSSPKVNEREVWGKLVPYDQVWRAGANENTVVSFSHDVQINGSTLPAGKYGLHMIPSEGDWTVIFSKNHTSWGSYSYTSDEDALRLTVTPKESAHHEYLGYAFENPTANSAELTLYWEKMAVPVKIDLNIQEIMLANIRNELRGLSGFGWVGPQQAANYCVQNEINYEEALHWIDLSINNQTNFSNLATKSQLLEKMGKSAEAEATMNQGLDMANNQELYAYGSSMIGQGNNKKALEVYELAAKKFPGTWLSYAGLAAGNRVNGNAKEALKYYKMAKNGAPEQWQAPLDARIQSMEEEAKK